MEKQLNNANRPSTKVHRALSGQGAQWPCMGEYTLHDGLFDSGGVIGFPRGC